MRTAIGLLAACLLLPLLSGCQRQSYAADDASKVHVGIVFDTGGKDDRSFNSAAWQGVSRAAKEFPLVLRDVEPGDPTSIEPAIRAFAERGYDLIIALGFVQGPIIDAVAKDYPKRNFVVVDSVIDRPNVTSIIFK